MSFNCCCCCFCYSIEAMAKVARLSIEKESRINECLMLEDKDLIIDYVCNLFIFYLYFLLCFILLISIWSLM